MSQVHESYSNRYLKALANSRLPFRQHGKEIVVALLGKLVGRGYCVTTHSNAWLVVRHPDSDLTVQLEMDVPQRLDMIQLGQVSNPHDSVYNRQAFYHLFPLADAGTQRGLNESVTLTKDNLDFIITRMDKLFHHSTLGYSNYRMAA